MIVMPEAMSVERRQMIQEYGAELVLTEGSKGMKGAIERAKELAKEIPNSFIPSQFTNKVNPAIHYLLPAAAIVSTVPIGRALGTGVGRFTSLPW